MCVVSPLSPKRAEGHGDPLILYSDNVLLLFVFARDSYLEVFARDKGWPFPLLMLLLPFPRGR